LPARAIRDRHRKDAGVPRPAISRRGVHAGPARHPAAVRLEEFLMQMHSLAFDVSHTLAGGLVLISLMMLYQDRLYSLLTVFALSVVLLGLLVMVTRRNAVSQVVGFMSLENGLVLAATGAKGMPLVVEISVAFSILIAFIVIGIFLFRIRERFDSVDVSALDDFRGERR